MESNQNKPRYPTMDNCVEIIGQQITPAGKVAQLRFMAKTQGDDFARKVREKAIAAGKWAKLK